MQGKAIHHRHISHPFIHTLGQLSDANLPIGMLGGEGKLDPKETSHKHKKSMQKLRGGDTIHASPLCQPYCSIVLTV